MSVSPSSVQNTAKLPLRILYVYDDKLRNFDGLFADTLKKKRIPFTAEKVKS